MVNININNQEISVEDGTTILNAASKAGIVIPHLCYVEGINDIAACRVCVVEVEGKDSLVAACNTKAEDGMKILTNSPKVRSARRTNVELILSNHDNKCVTCIKNGNCTLQTIANDLGIMDVPYKDTEESDCWDRTYPLIRDNSKCVKCMRCVQVCDNIQDLHIWDMIGTGARTTIGVKDNEKFEDVDCSLCGQCITHCPVGALHERDDTGKMFKALADPETVTMVQVAPAVRAAWGESIGLPKEENTMERMVDALRKLGFDYIFDTVYTADLTIMEEGSEFIQRFTNKDEHKWPMFTSCCPGWLRFVTSQYPELVPNLSTAKSPQQMFGALSKTYIAQKLGVDPEKVFSVSIMPCTAKKFESNTEQVHDSGFGKDVDLVLTTREVGRMVKADNIQGKDLKEAEFDMIFGEGSGAGVIFGATGGVMEAALRSAYYLITGENPPVDAFKQVRGLDGWKEAVFDVKGTPVKVAVANGLGNTRKLIEAIKAGEVEYDFVEIMACPGGCAGGGGQPIHNDAECASELGQMLYDIDSSLNLRFSHENTAVQLTYEEFLGEPLGHKSHELLHTILADWEIK